MPNLNAALACAQLESLDSFINDKRALAAGYEDFFKGSRFHFYVEPAHCRSNYWLNVVLMKNRNERDAFLTSTNDSGVMTRPAWTLMNKLQMFEKCYTGNIDNSLWIEDRLVNIPSSVRTNDSK
jgi:dTDP-4-amino-4,6-dideoxygalactose transaminase